MTELEARKHNATMITRLCEKHGCSDKKKKIHFDQMVHRAWNPHPSQEFENWWHTHPDFRLHGIDVVRARNCKCYCDEYKEAVETGIAQFPIDYHTDK